MNLERYEILKKHLPEEAARVIAEAFPPVEHLVTRDYLDARLAEQASRFEVSMRGVEASMHRWMLTLMTSLWLGLGGMIIATVLKG